MGNLKVMHVGGSAERIKRLPGYQEFLAVIRRTEIQPVGPKGDQDLELTFEVIAGPSKGRRIRQRTTIWSHELNRSLKGRAKFATLCRALDVVDPSDSAELRGKPLILRLTRKRGMEHRPSAGFSACSEADRRAWEGALAQSEENNARQEREESDSTPLQQERKGSEE